MALKPSLQMEVSHQELVKIVERASTITERLGNGFIPERTQVNDKLIDSRLERWCKAVAQGNQEKFAKRLAWDGLDIDTVRWALGNVHLSDAQHLPMWAETLGEVLQTDLTIGDGSAYRCLNPEEPIPFEEIYLPFIQIAKQKLIAQLSNQYHLLSSEVQISLERSLLLQLASICFPTLQFEFSFFSLLKESKIGRFLKQLQGNHTKQLYQEFIKNITAGGLLSLLHKYSVLARLVAVTTDFWVEATAEFIQRLESDLPIIQQTFHDPTSQEALHPISLQQVVAISAGLSDSHNRGRSVLLLSFASGLKLVYKPKDLGLEAAYFSLLDWFNQHNSLLPFKLLKVISCGTYGWVEYVENLPCEDEAAAKRYYQRSGMLLCLFYVLQATDCHQENLIACGEQPVLVDLETIMHPQVCEISEQGKAVGARFIANQQLLNSVLQSGLLPRWDLAADGRVAYDVSGFGGVGEQKNPFDMPIWKNVNTDNMALGYESGTIPNQANASSLNGVTLSPNYYVDEIVDGFRQMYQFLVEHRDLLLQESAGKSENRGRNTDEQSPIQNLKSSIQNRPCPLATFADQRVRFVFRATEVYGRILSKTSYPKFLQDGAERSIELDVVSRAFVVADTKPPAWTLLAAELQALEQMDIPHFTANANSVNLTLSPALTIEGYFKEPSYDLMRTCLQNLDDTDLVRQISIIRASLYSRDVTGIGALAAVETLHTTPLQEDTVTSLNQEALVQQAVAIAQELQHRAIWGRDSSATWLGIGYLAQAQRLQLQPLDYGLYDGVCGVALFLAALEKITDGAGFRDLALGCLQQLCQMLREVTVESQSKIVKQIGIGGATGLGSIVYALVRISQFLNEPNLFDMAKRAAALITLESIEGDRQFDVIAGTAGTILGLLTLHECTDISPEVSTNEAILNQAITCGRHLLANRIKGNSGLRAWATLENKLITGFSHGASGIAYALLRLYKTTQEPIFLEAAEEAIAYERSVISCIDGNWPDLRSSALIDGKPSFMTSWCHGAPGTGLARLGGIMVLNTTEVLQEIEIALDTTQKFGLQNFDTLCCGNFGRMELLLVASQKLSRQDLWEFVQKQTASIVARVKQEGGFYLFPHLDRDIYNPGFFQGTSGIGYELLRLAYPDLLPSVLLWQ